MSTRIAFRRVLPLVLMALAVRPARGADSYRIVRTYPHDAQAFTQGLLYVDGHIYESTGLYGKSSLRMVDLESGHVLQQLTVPDQYFAEGLAAWDNALVQLTWQSHVAFVYDRFSFRLLRTVPFSGEGWGLTHDGHVLILSDGSPVLRFLDPITLTTKRRITVRDGGRSVENLNELEYVRGEIYANIWHSDRIARISPSSGKVLGWIDLTGLAPSEVRTNSDAVLNGIAYDPVHYRLFVTGKLWPLLFEIQVVPSAPVKARRHKNPIE